ncbi:ferredoxin [Streptomyces sp. NPDC057307]|uniref:ferredoxin n=1 Tax=Streptomyces sp. NPDC057307 TaxID=3346096 RepID=UPI003643BA46
MVMKVAVDRDICCGAGQCGAIAPGVFDEDDNDGLVILLTDSPAPEHHAHVREAVDACPAAAISITE